MAKCITIFLFLFLVKNATTQVLIANVKDSSTAIVIASISIQGNKKTKSYIVTREITFAQSDTLPYKDLITKIDRSKKNIFNTALFNDVIINAVQQPTNAINFDIIIELKERWYILPEPVFELYDRNYKVWWKDYNADIRRIKYGIKFKYNNFSGRRDQLRINVINGFSKEISVGYSQPFADRKLRHGFGLGVSYANRIGVTFIDSFNAGLPRKICAGDSCVIGNYKLFSSKSFSVGANYQYRKGLYDRHIVTLNYTRSQVSDTLLKSNPNYFWNGIAKAAFVDLSYFYSFNKIDYFAYPLEGIIFNGGIKKRFSTQGLNQWVLNAEYGRFFQLKKKLFFSTIIAASTRFNENDKSFYNQRTADLAYGNIRGFEQFLIIPKSDISLRNSLRYKVVDKKIKLPIKVKNHESIPIKLYARIFGDIAYIHLPKPNASILHNRFLKGAGFALDLITIYDFVWRFELSYNKFTQLTFFIR